MRPVRNRYHCRGGDGVALDHPPRTAPDAARHQPGHPGGAQARLRGAGGGHCVSTRPKVRAPQPTDADPHEQHGHVQHHLGHRVRPATPPVIALRHSSTACHSGGDGDTHSIQSGSQTHREERAREQEQREDDDPHDDGERGIAVLGDAQADSGAPIASARARWQGSRARPTPTRLHRAPPRPRGRSPPIVARTPVHASCPPYTSADRGASTPRR